jgi:hypothetical protein
MGASLWSCRTDYQPDPLAAFEAAQARVFRDDAFYIGANRFRYRLGLLTLDRSTLPEDVRDDPDYLEWVMAEAPSTPDEVARCTELAALDRPRSIPEAREWNGEDGTHSILDFTGIGDEPGFGIVWLPTESWMIEQIGSATPSLGQLESLADELPLDRWHAVMLTAYSDGAPSDYLIVGVSGD